LDFILHISYVVDACVLPSILPSLSLRYMMYCTPEKKDAGVVSGRRLLD